VVAFTLSFEGVVFPQMHILVFQLTS